MKNEQIKLDGRIEDLISQLQQMLDTDNLRVSWKGDNETNIPDTYGIKAGGYFDGKKHLHKVEIIITPNK